MKLPPIKTLFLSIINAGCWPRIAALLFIGFILREAIADDVATGNVAGDLWMVERAASLPGSWIELYGDNVSHHRKVKSDANGHFNIRAVPEGEYRITAHTKGHDSDEAIKLEVREGATTTVRVRMKRSYPVLNLGRMARVFRSGSEIKLPIRGYVDSDQTSTSAKSALKLRIYKTRISTVLANSDSRKAYEKWRPSYEDRGLSYAGHIPEKVLSAKPPEIAEDRDVTIQSPDNDGFFYRRLKVKPMEPGLYLVEATLGTQYVSTWFQITDLALVTKRARGQLTAFVADLNTGEPLADSRVEALLSQGKSLSARTNKDGLATLRLEGKKPYDYRLVAAYRGDDETLVKNEPENHDEAENNYAVHAYGDRTVYRPGQTIQFKGIARKVIEPGSKYAVLSGTPVDVEMRDPTGERVYKEQKRCSDFGSFAGQVNLSSEAKTGSYTLVTTIDGETHNEEMFVAAYRKPEFKVEAKVRRPYYIRGETVDVDVSAAFYFGTPMAGGVAHYTVYHTYASENDDEDAESGSGRRYSGYRSFDESVSYGSPGQSGTVELDENGKAVLHIPLKPKSDGAIRQREALNINVTVTDDAEREESASTIAVVMAGDYRLSMQPVGYLAEPGRQTDIAISVVDHNKHAVPNCEVKIRYHEGYRYYDDEAKKPKVIDAGIIKTDALGNGVFQFVPPKSGSYELESTVVDSHDRSITETTYIYAYTQTGDVDDMNTSEDSLQLLTNKHKFAAGEKARIMIRSAHTGQSVLVTVEGDRVYQSFVVHMTGSGYMLELPLPAEYGPNVTLSVLAVNKRHLSNASEDLRIETKEHDVNVAITQDRPVSPKSGMAKYGPGERVTYHVKTTDSTGKPLQSEVSLAVVDEAIFAIKAADPKAIKDAFFPKRMNRVRMDYSFETEYLGGETKDGFDIAARKKFVDTAYWSAFVKTDASGMATTTITLPDNLTTWRATALAHTLTTQVGYGTSKILSTRDFSVRVELPRFSVEQDRWQLTAIVHNDTPRNQEATVLLRSNGLQVEGDVKRRVSVRTGRSATLTWPVITMEPGAKVDVTAVADATASKTGAADRVELPVVVSPFGRDTVTALSGSVESKRPAEHAVVMEWNAVAHSASVTVRVSPGVKSVVSSALEYLTGFPYGCTEQTMSRMLPDLLASKLKDPPASVKKLMQSGKLRQMVADSVSRLGNFQHESGGWGWWTHDSDDQWMTAYVLMGLSMARDSGFPSPKPMRLKGANAAVKFITEPDCKEMPFLIYAISLSGEPQPIAKAKQALEKMDVKKMDAVDAALSVLASHKLKVNAFAFKQRLRALVKYDAGGSYWDVSERWGHWSPIEASALALMALSASGKSDSLAASTARRLITHRTGDYWESTRHTGWTVMSLLRWSELTKEVNSGTGTVRIAVNGDYIDARTTAQQDGELIFRAPAANLKFGTNLIAISSEGNGERYYSIAFRRTVTSKVLPEVKHKAVTIKREFLKLVRKKDALGKWTIVAEPCNNRYHVGDNVIIRLTTEAKENLTNAIMEDRFPAGLEPTEAGEVATDTWSFWFSHLEVRDDRIAFFANNIEPGKSVWEYHLRAQTPGVFAVMPATIQMMYRPSVRAETSSDHLEVLK